MTMDPTDGHVVDPICTPVVNAPAAPTTMPHKAKPRTAVAPSPSSTDVTSLSAAIARIAPSDSNWLLQIERAANASLSVSPKCRALFIDVVDLGNPRVWADSSTGDALDDVRSMIGIWPRTSAPGFVRRLLSGAKCFTVSARLDEGLYKRWSMVVNERCGVRDALCVSACRRPGEGVLLWFPLAARAALPRATARRWELVAKLLLGAVAARSEGVGEPNGAGVANARRTNHGGRTAHLVASVRAKVDECSPPVLSPVDARSFRHELLRGEWSLLDHFDRDGKRYFAWARGSGRSDQRRSLTKREKDVLERVATGHSDRSIAMELRCSSSTIATHRLRAMSKIGLRSRALFSQILACVASDEMQ
jgi:DNA-binding CsgD family transcriptional regulator